MKGLINAKSIILTILIAIVASALWENLFKHALNFVSRILLTISTLGIEKYKNNIYVDIAKGFYENASLTVVAFIFGGLLALVFITFFPVFRKNEEYNSNRRRSKIKDWLSHHEFIYRSALYLYVAFFVVFTILNVSKLAYVNKSIAYYNQLINISQPYQSLDQERVFNSRFSQIRNSKDYTEIIEDLKKIILKENQKLPEAPSFIF